LVQVSRDQKIDALYNVFVARGTATVTKADGTTQQVPIQSVAQITTGPLRVGGPQTVTLNGKVKTMHLQSNGNTVAAMTLTVECTYADVQAALGTVTRG
jgi:hypothetical protein